MEQQTTQQSELQAVPQLEHNTSAPATVTYAGFWKRSSAYILDSIFLFIPALIVDFIFTFILFLFFPVKSHPGIQAANTDFVRVLNGIISIVYFAYTESSPMQATYGKNIMNIKVTDMEGKRLTFSHALGRELAKALAAFIGVILFLVGLIVVFGMAGWTKKKQALHDKMAGTLVVNR